MLPNLKVKCYVDDKSSRIACVQGHFLGVHVFMFSVDSQLYVFN